MLFADNIAVDHEVIVAAIVIALFIFTRFWCTPTHVQSKSSSNFSLRHRLPKSASAKLSHIQDVNLVQIFNDWLTYTTENVKASQSLSTRSKNIWVLCHSNTVKCECSGIFVRVLH